jgi:hypothetical protein
MNILQACADPNLFSPWFRDPASWRAWRAFLAALFALPMDDEALPIYRACTGRAEPPEGPFDEAWLICGRRGGKSFTMALVGAFLAAFRDYRAHLAPGERATIPLIAADRRQARTLARYVRALLLEVPMLRRMVESETRESFDLSNRTTIEIHTASFRSVRGYTLAGALCDEVAFWPQEDSATPDEEILAALRPGLASIPGSVLLLGSSPHAKRGELWNAYRRYHGQDGALVLTWRADTRTMNPRISERVVEDAYERDAARAAAEYGAQFRADIESFISLEAVEACVEPGCLERAPLGGLSYSAFVDPSGGAVDSMTMAIAHVEGERAVLDCVRERKAPFSPDDVVAEFAAALKSYRIRKVRGDRYAGEWPRQAFAKQGITYEPADEPKSELYRDLLPLFTSRRAELLDLPRLVSQVVALERRTSRGGRESIDHPPGGHDDLANAVAGVLVTAAKPASSGPAVVKIRGMV